MLPEVRGQAAYLNQVDCTDPHDGQIAGIDKGGATRELIAQVEKAFPGTRSASPTTADPRKGCRHIVRAFLGDHLDDSDFPQHMTIEPIVITDRDGTPRGGDIYCAIRAPSGTQFHKSYAPPGTPHTLK